MNPIKWLALACTVLGATLSACPDRGGDVRFRTVDECRDGGCECAFTSECPGELQCLDGVCRSQSVVDEVIGGSDTRDASDTDTTDTTDTHIDGDTNAPRLFSEFCNTNRDCESGYCLETPTGGYCTRLCNEGCPQDWNCRTVTQTIDVVSLCARDTSRLCLPCDNDRLCGDAGLNLCLEVGGGHFCGRECSTESCPEGYACQTIPGVTGPSSRQCLPLNGTCDCTPLTAGLQKTCTNENELGTCFGVATCDPAVGFVGCTARAPIAEACNGLDDDCDGATDEGQEPRACTITNEFGACTGMETCQGPLGWSCNATTPIAELCNERDDDCDNEIDEDFKLGGDVPATAEHCGVCGNDCSTRFPFSDGVRCDLSGPSPICVLESCQPGYVLLSGSCVDENTTLCTPCSSDSDCFGLASRCLSFSDTDPRAFCSRDCTGENETSAQCPASYRCDVIDDGEQCVPVTASCDCTQTNAGAQKACSRVNEIGTCFGLETCDPALGWNGCTAIEPAAEVCDGIDNDCDGQIDDGIVTGLPCEIENEIGLCVGTTFCAGAGGLRCSAAPAEAESCNGRDDDCDGVTDEGFATDVGGVLVYDQQVAHCGACNYACPAIAHGTATCEAGVARCVVASCEEGYMPGPGNATCVPVPRANQCAPCNTNTDCQGPGDRCVNDSDAGRVCARDCGVDSIYGTEQTPCTGVAGEVGCCPAGNVCTAVGADRICRPQSGTCACTETGATVACEQTNTFGTCFGVRTCNASVGLSSCNAPAAARELCNDIDDDCDGLVDQADSSLDMSTTPNGQASCGDGPGCPGQWRCVAGAWDCTAREGSPEVCDTLDNDCDGQTDEDFRDGQGRYISNQHCGGCGLDCSGLVVNATATACTLVSGAPTCVATTCAPGTYPADGGRTCLQLPDNQCLSCTSDADCLVPSTRCVGTGVDRYCARSCAANSPYGATCPLGSVCTGGAQAQCVPASGSCQCGPGDDGVTRACTTGGGCVGLQTCEESGGGYAFSTCSAEGLIAEVCDGLDNDCDGRVDEGFVDAGGAYTTDVACGECGNNCLLRWTAEQHAIGTCSGGQNPRCVIGQCTREVVGGTTYEYVDTNSLPGDGCECRKVQGVTADEPDTDFGTTRPSASQTYADANCDGIDGVIGNALFVRAGATAPGNGTLATPYPTITQAIAAFATSGKQYILVAGGEYRENIALRNGVKLHGGYSPDFKSRNIVTFETRIVGVEPAFGVGTVIPGTVYAAGITTTATLLSGFTIRGYDVTTSVTAAAAGYTSYAVFIVDSNDRLELRNNRIVGGVGGRGGDGASGTNGFGRTSTGGTTLDGSNGINVESGGDSCTGTTCNNDSRAGGAGGTNAACGGANGIAGGNATCPTYNGASWTPPIANKDGAPGYHWTRDGSTSNDTCSGHLTEAGFPNNIKKLDGLDGASGNAGSGGLQGLGCSSGEGQLVGGEWRNGGGADGATGGFGLRGGAGAPSGGVATNQGNPPVPVFGNNSVVRYKLGASGGGAGAGGCGGTGGRGSGSGGASIAVFVAWVGGATTSAPRFVANLVERGLAGDGGTGGYGGTGGVGGDGGRGGNSSNFWVGFRAGNGGRGGTGGEGGGGGGGCGGASYGFAVFGKPAALTVNYAPNNAFAIADAVSTGGRGGQAGPSGSTRPGATGTNGSSQNQIVR